jgi:hypothetical protein
VVSFANSIGLNQHCTDKVIASQREQQGKQNVGQMIEKMWNLKSDSPSLNQENARLKNLVLTATYG